MVARALPAEARVPPKPKDLSDSMDMVARVLPAEACVPPKPTDSSPESGSHSSNHIGGRGKHTRIAVPPLHILKTFTLSELEALENYYAGV
jgi:hypothetical protein